MFAFGGGAGGAGGFGFGGFGGGGQRGGGQRGRGFRAQYRCYPVTFHDKGALEDGDKIVLPQSALNRLLQLMIDYPMLFQLSVEDDRGEVVRRTHCGVMEFTAKEGECFIPYWMMQNLLIQEGDLIWVTNVGLGKATFLKFKPETKDFLDISNPKAVLETALRKYSCMTQHDRICVPYNGKKYYMEVLEVKPNGKACVIECDVNIDFAPPADYVEPDWKAEAAKAAAAAAGAGVAGAVAGAGNSGGSGMAFGSSPGKKSPAGKKKGGEKSKEPAHNWGSGRRLDGKPAKRGPGESAADLAAARIAREKQAAARAAAAERRRVAAHARNEAKQAEKVRGAKRKISRVGRKRQDQAFSGTARTLG